MIVLISVKKIRTVAIFALKEEKKTRKQSFVVSMILKGGIENSVLFQ